MLLYFPVQRKVDLKLKSKLLKMLHEGRRLK